MSNEQMTLSIEKSEHLTPTAEVEAVRANPGFALHPTDHMVSARWKDGKWGDFRVHAYEVLQLDPRAMALHYGQAIFEGMKAFAMDDGAITVFRPESNAARFALSAERMAMPPFPVDLFVEACDALIRIDQRWVPTAPGTSLYIRPVMFATEAHVGIRSALQFDFLVLALPTAPFFSSNFEPISVGVLDRFVRAAKGGTGEAKCAGNYAASLLAKQQIVELGCSEVLWLDAEEHSRVEELSGMNVFFVERRADGPDRLITPPLGGTVLRGITRDSLLALANALGYETVEREITIEEVERRAQLGELTEAFACGTAAVIAPIAKIVLSGGKEVVFGVGDSGDTTTRLYNELVAIQVGRSELFPSWRHLVTGASVTA